MDVGTVNVPTSIDVIELLGTKDLCGGASANAAAANAAGGTGTAGLVVA